MSERFPIIRRTVNTYSVQEIEQFKNIDLGLDVDSDEENDSDFSDDTEFENSPADESKEEAEKKAHLTVQGAARTIIAGYRFVNSVNLSKQQNENTQNKESETGDSNNKDDQNKENEENQTSKESENNQSEKEKTESTGNQSDDKDKETCKLPRRSHPSLYNVASTLISMRRASNSIRFPSADKVEMVQEGVNGKPVVCVGTVRSLVSLFVAVGELDSDYVLEFLVTHRLFTQSMNVLQYLIAKFGHLGKPLEGKKTGVDQVQDFTQNRIILVLEQWLYRHPGDFVNNPQLTETLTKFLKLITPKILAQKASTLQSLLESAPKRLNNSIAKAKQIENETIESKHGLSLITYGSLTTDDSFPSNSSNVSLSTSPVTTSPNSSREGLTPFPSLMSSNSSGSLTLPFNKLTRGTEFPTDFKSASIADQLSIEELRLFKSIPEDEFFNFVAKNGKETGKIKIFAKWSHLVSQWVANEVCKPDDVKNRAEVIKFFLVCASQCQAKQNYNGLYEIIRGLSLSPCQRLAKTWKAIPQSAREIWQDLSHLVSSKDNYRVYREKLRNSTGNILPIFKVYLNDLSIVSDKMPNEFPNNRINFYKFHVIGNILNNIYFCQKNTDYENVEDNMTREYIAEALSTAANSDSDALVKLSRAREPPLPAAECIIFGVDLSIAVDRTGVIASTTEGTVPSCVRDIVEALRTPELMKTLGIFRKSGSVAQIKKMKAQFDRVGGLSIGLESMNGYDLAGLLKHYFSELPDPLFTGLLFLKFTAVSEIKDRQRKIELIRALLSQLPKPHLDTSLYLLHFLAELSTYEETNQMGAKNLAVCFGPTLFGKKKHVRKISRLQGRMSQALDLKKQETLGQDMKKQAEATQVLQFMIEYYSDLIESLSPGKDRIDYTRKDSVVQL